MKKILIWVFACIWLFFALYFFLESPEIQKDIPIIETPKVLLPETNQEKPVSLKNSVKISYIKTSKFSVLEKKYKEKKLLEAIFTSLWEFIKLPKDLTAEYSECWEENAFYDPATKKITVCYEIVEWAESLNKTDTDEVSTNILTFFILHEVGHALVNLYELPTTGREEDVADQLATFFLLGSNDQWALDTADSFYKDLKDLNINDLPFSDEHSLDNQRYYDILCWVYGSDTKTYEYLVKEEFIPQDRAEQCEWEFVSMNNSFVKLLEKYLVK